MASTSAPALAGALSTAAARCRRGPNAGAARTLGASASSHAFNCKGRAGRHRRVARAVMSPRAEAISEPPPAAAVETKDAKQEEVEKIQNLLSKPYSAGFRTNIESDTIPKGLSEDTVRLISAKKEEPEWMLEFRLKAFRKWLTMEEPDWSDNSYPEIDYQAVSYYSAPKKKEKLESLDEVDPELLATFDKLGIPLSEQKRLTNVAVDVVFDSVSIATTFRKDLAKVGVIFCSMSEAIREYPELIKKHLGSVIPVGDNYFTALNSAVFSDGSFCYIPKGVRSPMELSTYFRINEESSGQFERTLIVAEEDSYVSYLEGCTAPAYDQNQLHAAVVEISCAKNAQVKYSTVQNWYAGNEEGKGGIYNFVTKRGLCKGDNSKISWTQVETGSAITWKYPSVVLAGDNSVGEFFSVALTNNMQQADTGTKMIHVGKNTRSRIVSKGISAGQSRNVYRGLVQVAPSAVGARNYSQCDSMLIGDRAGANTYPYINVREPSARVEHEASTSKIGEDQLFYFQQRGIDPEAAVGIIISGFCNEVFNELPMEFAAEVNQLMSLKLEGSVG
uniref:Uncharacterized protein n=1 Tax=Mantoniella antarctica TaxID=81844 RepID=A0A7S0X8P3_9CHLO|mmetsp:Transcript_27041/g.67620  ORF Transcript_27041/g.67620 Transcript_27041/m.67620 type:complete len:561 (+) Transcript_27041:80-1762(+)|eukprot:CAMPEP_0181391586 /NCGR_PEP_ID=MMETSP1106-20121128/26127_1 /TAXON_ID=81844 /ORGANISM="Mantoniella antarctica, Strain SL-175" /LENGTH=560 /DNA_ID=CAMNT_0023512633 /DNA_START=35 /DNA_END=1717 /DNA_ORIENTATION=+